ncbi:glycosyltransferase family 4 protein [Lapillicoccus jejuensis]|uniref:glycosyltransferase family 4 protein n=1 Tax=Lapillicoccus jejuensis TaxID=402171 RepID=UPI00114DEA23|nr:glycosyltransferase family 4 protein [Lapillicoccus jejuensis]
MRTGKTSIAHVLVIVQNLPVPLDRRVWLECQALTAAGYQVSVICPKGPGDPARQEIAGVRLYKYRPAREAKGLLGFVWEFVYSWVRTALLSLVVWGREPFQVMQACNPPDTYWALARLWRMRGVRFVFDQHDLNPELFLSRFGEPEGLAQRTQYEGLLWLERMTYRQADHVLSTNESYRAIAQRRGGKAPEDVTVVRSGPDTRRMRPIRPRGSGWRGGSTLLTYLGVMGPQDNVDVLLEVMDDLVHRRGRDDVRLALLGFGDCLADLKAECHVRGLDGHVLFTGRVGPAEIAEYLSSADIGLSPDRRTPLNDASTMNKAMEYMAYGLPAVSFDLTETRVSAGPSALYVPDGDVVAFADAVEELIDDPDRRVRMGELARHRVVADLDWRPQASAYVAAFDRVSGYVRTQPLPDLLPALVGPSPSTRYVEDQDPVVFRRFLRERGRLSRAHDLTA